MKKQLFGYIDLPYILASVGVIFIVLFLNVKEYVHAVSCSRAENGQNIITSDCNYPSTIDGEDSGTGSTQTSEITVGVGNTSATLTISVGQTLAVGSLQITKGSVAILSGGQIKIGSPLYVQDDDSDYYAGSSTQSLSSVATGHTMRRRNLVSPNDIDCNDIILNTDSNLVFFSKTCYPDADSDTYTIGSVGCTNDKTCTSATYASSIDGVDVKQYTGGRLLAGASASTDCYDGNATAKPGQTGWVSTNRGDGSYDYSCDGVETQEVTAVASGCTQTGCSGGTWKYTSAGWITSAPACGVAQDYANTVCRTGGTCTKNVTNAQRCH